MLDANCGLRVASCEAHMVGVFLGKWGVALERGSVTIQRSVWLYSETSN